MPGLLGGRSTFRTELLSTSLPAASSSACEARRRVETTDTNPSPPLPAASLPQGGRGRGLLLVDALADDWGTAPTPSSPGKAGWFALRTT